MDRHPFNNQSLFSEYYLQELIRDDDFWAESLGKAQEAWEKIRGIYAKVGKRLIGANEAETEHLFIRPVLETIGHIYGLQPAVRSPEGTRHPDFAFFATETDLTEAEKDLKGRTEYFSRAIAIGDAKHWDRSLDKKLKGPGDPFTNHNPSYQIDFYLRATNCRWGILTNGRLWRLYNRDSSYRFDIYYGIDLPSLLEGDRFEAEAFAYFFAFFRKDAFVKPIDRECFLDRAYKSSLEYTSRLGEELKENVYEALRLLAEGFLRFPGNALSTDGDLDRIRENAFVLIYRILFTLYAEDRGLLPVHNPIYQSYSLRRLAREVAEKLDQRVPLSPTVSGYWARVTDLFRIVNEGDGYLDVPPYNGGLFDDTKHPFLTKYRIGDSYLAQTIERLTRAEASGRIGRGFLSYRDMEIRHLGSIYEGLLEHRLRVPQVDIAVIKEDKKEKFVPASEAGKRRVLKTYKAGEVYLETDKGERKATGSYYTPDYIVKYIVGNTLGPVIQERKQKIRKKLENLKEKVKIHRGANREAYERELKRAESELIDEILSIKVLDPAMGSGHFLVEATDYLARALVEALLGEAALETPMAEARLTREEPLPYGVKTVASEPASDEKARLEEEDIRWARREVVEKCIYGADLNPLAVELAKLSLWLYTVAINKPLNFLDHHLRCGNSLIGARIKDLTALPALRKKKVGAVVSDRPKPLQLGLFEQVFKEKVNLLLKDFELIEMLPSETVEDIKKKDGYYQNFRKRVERFKEVADIWTSVYFGNEVAWQDYQTLQEKLRITDQEWQELKQKPWFVKGLQITEQKRFFHWELEFPEVFYEGAQEKENPGFDVVVGNPPYGSAIPSEDRVLIVDRFESARRVIDNYLLFMEKGLQLCQENRRLGFIVPSGWLTAVDYSVFRKVVLDLGVPEVIVHLPYDVFLSAYIDTIIIVLLKCSGGLAGTNPNYKTRVKRYGIRDSAMNLPWDRAGYQLISPHEWLHDDLIRINTKAASPFSAVMAKITQLGVPLGDLVKVDRGITPFKAVPKTHPSAAPGFHGDFDRYVVCPDPGIWVQYDESLNEYLPPEFTRGERLIMRRIISRQFRLLAALYDNELLFNKSYLICLAAQSSYRLGFITSIANSRLMAKWFTDLTEIAYRDDFPQIDIYTLKQIPIRRIPFTTPEKERARLLEKGKTLYDQCLAKNDRARVLDLVAQYLKQEPEQADVVHDLLAFLAEQMVELNRQKQTEICSFLEWLEREIGAKFNDLKQKTNIRAYYEGTFEDLLEALKENRKALAVDPSRKAFQECLKAEFDGSRAKLQPLKERLVATDRLIDQIVYQLYGLTQEEIALVEGTSLK